jgi:hypothetical protein
LAVTSWSRRSMAKNAALKNLIQLNTTLYDAAWRSPISSGLMMQV